MIITGWAVVEKIGKVNWYTPLVKEEEYLQKESKNIIQKMYRNSLKNFVAALYDGNGLSEEVLLNLPSVYGPLMPPYNHHNLQFRFR